MAASTTQNPTTTTTPIPGAIAFNTTGYPTPQMPPSAPPPPQPSGAPTVEKMVPIGSLSGSVSLEESPCAENSYVALPINPALEFSIADLRLLGNVTDIGDLVFEMIFINPETAQVDEFKLEIASPERKQLYLANLASEGCIHHSSHTIHTFSLNTKDAHKAEHLFVPGNRFIVHAKVSQAISEGKLQVAVRKYY